MANDAIVRQTTREVRVGGANIHVTEWGDGRTVLLLHGNPDSGLMWKEVAQRLGRTCRCVAPDLPGFGHSEVPAGYQPSLDGMADFVEQFVCAASINTPIDLIAHDFGGPFAFAWAVKHPGSVRRVVAINTVFFSDYRWHFWAHVWRTLPGCLTAQANANGPPKSCAIRSIGVLILAAHTNCSTKSAMPSREGW